MKHLDLFSGIGGFAYAVDQVWENAEHIFCDNDKFCQQVLKKHWPNSKIYNDIRTITDTTFKGQLCEGQQENEIKKDSREQGCGFSNKDRIITADTEPKGLEGWPRDSKGDKREEGPYIRQDGNKIRGEIGCLHRIDLLTGGFPCQPFSQAGKRRGTEDNRYLWPEMLRVIQLTHPQYVIAENVRGLLTQQGGLVFEQVCLDLEATGYEVQTFIIPAVAVNAPHRRDRVWIIAHSKSGQSGKQAEQKGWEDFSRRNSNAPDTRHKDAQRHLHKSSSRKNEGIQFGTQNFNTNEWEQNWLEVATKLCGMDDGLSPGLDFVGWAKAQHRVQRLKALGNAIVPKVAIEIMKAIKEEEI